MVPSLLLALRLAKLNAGMTLNGILYARLMQEQTFTDRAGPEAPRCAARVNVFGVSFLMFLLADLLASFAAALLDLSLVAGDRVSPRRAPHRPPSWAPPSSWPGCCSTCTSTARRPPTPSAGSSATHVPPSSASSWEEHVADSLRDANHDMITMLALVGLIVFSAFEGLSSLGKVTGETDLRSQDVRDYGPLAYGLLMTVTCFMGLVTYVRLRVAVGVRSLQIDPNDRPFRLAAPDRLAAGLPAPGLPLRRVAALPALPVPGPAPLLFVDAATFAARRRRGADDAGHRGAGVSEEVRVCCGRWVRRWSPGFGRLDQ